MDQSDLAGSKKYKGIQTKESFNRNRKQQISTLLNDDSLLNDPNLIKYNDKFLCKTCNTLHTNLTSFKRHINGKKHLLKVKAHDKKPKDKTVAVKKITKDTENDKQAKKFMDDLKTKMLKKFNVKNKNADIHNTGSLIPSDKISFEYTIDDSMDDKDTIGLLIKIDLSFNKDDKEMLFLKYLSKEEQISTDPNTKKENDVLVIYILNYKPVVVDIPKDMKLIFNQKDEFVKINDVWYIQLRFVVSS